jgi:hypothetical protein
MGAMKKIVYRVFVIEDGTEKTIKETKTLRQASDYVKKNNNGRTLGIREWEIYT